MEIPYRWLDAGKWLVTTHTRDVSPEEMKSGGEEGDGWLSTD